MEDIIMWLLKLRLESKTTPRLRAESVGVKETFLKVMDVLVILDLCCVVQISRYSVFEDWLQDGWCNTRSGLDQG